MLPLWAKSPRGFRSWRMSFSSRMLQRLSVRWMNSGESRISSTLILPRYCWLSAIIIDSFFCCRVRVRSARMMLALML